jgi:hypothetical protein
MTEFILDTVVDLHDFSLNVLSFRLPRSSQIHAWSWLPLLQGVELKYPQVEEFTHLLLQYWVPQRFTFFHIMVDQVVEPIDHVCTVVESDLRSVERWTRYRWS